MEQKVKGGVIVGYVAAVETEEEPEVEIAEEKVAPKKGGRPKKK
jgi:hypothetical protein